MPVPPQTDPFIPTAITMTSVTGDANLNGTGGAAILQWQVGYGTGPSAPYAFQNLDTNGGGTITGLTPGSTVYFWNRARNAHGWSPWSGRTMAAIKNVPEPPTRPRITEITSTTFRLTWEPNGAGSSPITGYRYYVGLINPPTVGVDTTAKSVVVTGLIPGERYYVRAQARNGYGLSAYTTVNSAQMGASSWVNVAGVNKRAVPYIRYAGVWRPAEPWVKIAGMWKRTE